MINNNNGWGIKEMLFLSAILLFSLLLVAVLINNLYSGLEKKENYNNQSNSYSYKDVEKNLKEAASKYLKKNKNENMNIILSDSLLEKNYLNISELTVNKDICEGYVLIENEKITPYISCPKYKTEGY